MYIWRDIQNVLNIDIHWVYIRYSTRIEAAFVQGSNFYRSSLKIHFPHETSKNSEISLAVNHSSHQLCREILLWRNNQIISKLSTNEIEKKKEEIYARCMKCCPPCGIFLANIFASLDFSWNVAYILVGHSTWITYLIYVYILYIKYAHAHRMYL